MSQNELVAVTGSTGYVGGRLVPRLLESGYRVRCVTRSPDSLTNRPWSDDVEIVVADLQDPVETFWYVLLPFHIVIFRRMLRNIVLLSK